MTDNPRLSRRGPIVLAVLRLVALAHAQPAAPATPASPPPAAAASPSPAAEPAPELVPASLFALPDDNLEITVWARSPQLRNPTNIDVDAQGRVWVTEAANYR